MVYYCRRLVSVFAWLSYLSFKASESDHFAMVAVTRCRRSFFYLVFHSSLLLRFHTPAFLQSACLLGADYSVELSSDRPTFHGLDLHCRSCHNQPPPAGYNLPPEGFNQAPPPYLSYPPPPNQYPPPPGQAQAAPILAAINSGQPNKFYEK